MNRGAERLAELFPNHGDQKKIAKDVGTDQSVVSRWIRGERKPKVPQRAKLEDLYGIGWRLWDDDVADAASGPVEAEPPSSNDDAAE